MAVYAVSFRTTLTTATANAPLALIRGSSTQRATLRELHIFHSSASTATAGGVGLARNTSTAVTSLVGAVTPNPRDPNESAAATAIATSWTGAPTLGAVFRRWSHGATIGSGVMWSWDLTAPFFLNTANPSNDLFIVNLNASTVPLYEVTVVLAE